jgi:hypothetical protein
VESEESLHPLADSTRKVIHRNAVAERPGGLCFVMAIASFYSVCAELR